MLFGGVLKYSLTNSMVLYVQYAGKRKAKLTFVCNLLHFYNKLWFRNGICFVTKCNIDDPEIKTSHY